MNATTVSTESLGLVARFRAALAARKAYAAQKRVYWQTYNELNAMTDRDLWDIGVNRGEIDRIAHEAAFGR